MSLLAKTAGTRRVVIDHVTPSIDGGRNPFKRVIGDWIVFQANAFADSHDLLQVELRVRKVNTEHWQVLPMQALGNDEFETTYRTDSIGLFEYEVAGVVDHYGSWHEGFKKKHQEGVPLDLECRIGAELLEQAAKRASEDHAEQLREWATHLADSSADIETRISLAYSRHVTDIARSYPQRAWETTSPLSLMLIERELAAFSAWYEYFPRSCVYDGHTHGSFKDAAKRLPEIHEMGFNIVYFPPIHPIGREFRKGKNNTLTPGPDDVGSPWAVGAAEGGHKSILPELGSLEDFQHFLDEAEMRGMEVALDIAFQCAPDHPWVKEHPQWFRWRPDGTVQYAENPPKKYQDILPINFESDDWENLWDELKGVFEFWIEQGVKVFRVDNPHTKSMEFWRWCILNIKARHPEVIFLAEAFTRPKRKYFLAKGGFTHGYTYFTWRNTAAELQQYVEELTQGDSKDYFWPNFWPNTPDILHADLQTGNRATFIGRYILAATLSSNVGIYGPAYELLDHEPYPGKEENNHSEKYQLKAWDLNQPGNIKAEIARVNALRNNHEAFQRTFNVQFIPCNNSHIIAYLKQNFEKTDRFIVVVNMDWENKQVGTLDLSGEALGLAHAGNLRLVDQFAAKPTEYIWHDTTPYLELNPQTCPAHIFQIID
ncbi:alpha-1,4-glucan--maltose-1-phosphate maltosyltransferase [Coraliomargarita sp. SDUM461003]|uniref:Alpha-1,4-glucan:maltose-1-phosphate maltosyltransferase n=1 Tax=Thalassobacterium maritimum TaxID=3041265 RepID=A0ABU1ATF3_9BACT|nr:alpha-1,4-glucan--maltose-1-phosphate maltosyltransferase [Coraliomargarita sp. SDUM461003]MDQ8207439.1 alpha-1,4-glucan--maltose-1-phosphate maltosyltransferase [Coraliomargarita sp. SDUM461003]